MIGTRLKSKVHTQNQSRVDESNFYFSKIHWSEVKTEVLEAKKGQGPPRRMNHSFVQVKGRVFLVGGSNKQTSKGYFGLFELILEKSPKGPETGVWKRHALVGAENLPIYTLDSHTTEVFEDQIYVFCGRVNSDISSKVFRIDVDKLTISECKIGPAAQGALGQRDSHISFMMQQRYAVLWGGVSGVIGGEDTQTLKMPEKDLLTLVDMEKMKRVELAEVEQVGKPPSQREGHCAVMHRNGIYIYGGLSVTGEPGGEIKQSPVVTKQAAKELKPVPEDLNSRKARMNKRRGMLEVGTESVTKVEASSHRQTPQDSQQDGGMDIEYMDRDQQQDYPGLSYSGFKSGGAHMSTDMMNSGEEGLAYEDSGIRPFSGQHQMTGPQGQSMMNWLRPQSQESFRGERGSEMTAFARPSNAPMSILGPLAQHHAPGGILYQTNQQIAANAQNQLKEAKQMTEDDKDEDMPDFLNDLYHLSYVVTADRFLFTWQRIEYSGELPRVAYPVGVSFEQDFLIFFGGEGYYLHKKYSQDALAESLNTISAVRLENKRAIRLHATGIAVEGIHCAACFTQKSSQMQPARIFLYGGQVPSNNMNQRLLVLDLEQRVQRDFFGEFRSLKPMCPCCKLEYETCVNNYEAQLKGNKRLQNRKLDGDRWDPMITEEIPRFVIPPEVQEDMLSALELQDEYLDKMPMVTDETAILSQITLIIYTLKKSLYLTSMNFDIAKPNAIAIELEGNFNIFEQLDKLEISIMDSIFYYLMNSACLLKIQASLFVRLKSKILEFTYSHDNKHEIVTLEHTEMPDLIKDVKFQSNLVVFSKCPVTFTRDEDPKEKDIRLCMNGQFKKYKVEYSIRAYFTLFFAYKEKDFTIKVFGKEVDHLYLEDIMKIGDSQKPVSVFEKNSSAKGIKFMLKQEITSRNKFVNEFLDRLTAIHYSMDYLTYVNHSEVNKGQHDADFRGSITIIMEKINPT